MLAFVTALYSIREGYAPQLIAEFRRLLEVLPRTTPVIVFTDLDLPSDILSRISVINAKLAGFPTYSHIVHSDAPLPAHRNPAKDTREFLALMNTKAEMVWIAGCKLPATITHIAWIDCGIHKILKPGDDVRGAFGQQSRLPTHKVLIPGCWGPQAHVTADQVNWRFCGGFFVVPRSLAGRFYHATEWTRHTHFAATPTWEVNVWAATEKWEPDLMTWWSADHNISMLKIPTSLLLP